MFDFNDIEHGILKIYLSVTHLLLFSTSLKFTNEFVTILLDILIVSIQTSLRKLELFLLLSKIYENRQLNFINYLSERGRGRRKKSKN